MCGLGGIGEAHGKTSVLHALRASRLGTAGGSLKHPRSRALSFPGNARGYGKPVLCLRLSIRLGAAGGYAAIIGVRRTTRDCDATQGPRADARKRRSPLVRPAAGWTTGSSAASAKTLVARGDSMTFSRPVPLADAWREASRSRRQPAGGAISAEDKASSRCPTPARQWHRRIPPGFSRRAAAANAAGYGRRPRFQYLFNVLEAPVQASAAAARHADAA